MRKKWTQTDIGIKCYDANKVKDKEGFWEVKVFPFFLRGVGVCVRKTWNYEENEWEINKS